MVIDRSRFPPHSHCLFLQKDCKNCVSCGRMPQKVQFKSDFRNWRCISSRGVLCGMRFASIMHPEIHWKLFFFFWCSRVKLSAKEKDAELLCLFFPKKYTLINERARKNINKLYNFCFFYYSVVNVVSSNFMILPRVTQFYSESLTSRKTCLI